MRSEKLFVMLCNPFQRFPLAVAHLQIRADVPANHSEEEGAKKEGEEERIQNSIRKEAF